MLQLAITLLFVSLARAASSSVYYPSSITDITSAHSDQAISVLAVKDQQGTQDTWDNYIEFESTSVAYSGIFNFDTSISNSATISSIVLDINFLGQAYASQKWNFDVYLNPSASSSSGSWVTVGDTTSAAGWGAWTSMSFAFPSIDYSRAIGASGELQLRFSSLTAYDNCAIDFVRLTFSFTGSSATPPPTLAPGSPTLSPPTEPSSPVTASFNLRMLILSQSTTSVGVDFVKLAFDSTGVAYDLVTVTSSSSLSTYLATSGTGKYAGIVSVTKLSVAQEAAITAYQVAYGVRWVLVSSAPSGLPGLSAGTTTTAVGKLTLASSFSQYASYLQPDMSVYTDSIAAWTGLSAATIKPATITDPSVATAAIMVTVGTQTSVAAAQIKTTSNTYQLHYFVTQRAGYFHSLVFAPMMVNWLSPGMMYQGARRIALLLQADDFLLSSNGWDTSNHEETTIDTYRMTSADLQNIADYYDALNPTLPAGSYMTVEWPFNGAGSEWFPDTPELLIKAQELQDKFWWISHTYTHPCDLDNATYAQMDTELKGNIVFEPTLLRDGLSNSHWSGDSLINPCITGLFNADVLRAMVDNGITKCVGDNTVARLQTSNPYHPIITTTAVHGYAGVIIVPRESLDIYYTASTPDLLVDAYNTVNQGTATFEEIMALQVTYGVENLLALRHDPYMMHQANGRVFTYDDPVAGKTHDVTFITLWTDRVVKQLVSYFNFPVMAPKMSDLAQMWIDRLAMDTCGFTATVQVSNNAIVSLLASSTSSCTVGISGVTLVASSTVRMETYGPETTAWVTMTAGVPQTLTLASPVSL